MTNNSNWAVGLVHELCPICLSKMNEQIIIPRKLTPKTKETIDSVHNKAVGISETPCKDCSKHVDNDYKAIIGVDPEKSDNTFRGKYRTGTIIWLKNRAIKRIFKPEAYNDSPFLFVVESVVQELIELSNKES